MTGEAAPSCPTIGLPSDLLANNQRNFFDAFVLRLLFCHAHLIAHLLDQIDRLYTNQVQAAHANHIVFVVSNYTYTFLLFLSYFIHNFTFQSRQNNSINIQIIIILVKDMTIYHEFS